MHGVAENMVRDLLLCMCIVLVSIGRPGKERYRRTAHGRTSSRNKVMYLLGFCVYLCVTLFHAGRLGLGSEDDCASPQKVPALIREVYVCVDFRVLSKPPFRSLTFSPPLPFNLSPTLYI